MKTVGKKILVAVKKVKEQKYGTLILPDAMPSATKTGIVIAVGPEVTSLKEGDTVVFESLIGVEVVATDELSTISLLEDNVLAFEQATKEVPF